jgi:NhaA family Na+:H+ antiporter
VKSRSDFAPAAFIRAFLKQEAASGTLLMVAAALALLAANSPLAGRYFGVQHVEVAGLSVLHWINDGLMALFFLLVGLEIKRELLVGQLATWSQRVLPGVAALGGMVVPAVIYVLCSRGDAHVLRGWAVPMATDIAFALGVLMLLGSRIPSSLKVFLTALAIIDDLGAVVVIALFYTSELSWMSLGLAGAALGVLVGMNLSGQRALVPYLLVGGLLWFFVLKSGIHATLAGVALALTIPLRGSDQGSRPASAPLLVLEHRLHPWIAFAVIPLFGFANAGVSFESMSLSSLTDPVPLGITLGLFAGKQAGVFGFSWIAVRAGWARLPAQSGWLPFYGTAILCGIGFTMSLFIASLGFASAAHLAEEAKIGVLAGSVLSAIVGGTVLRLSFRRPDKATIAC